MNPDWTEGKLEFDFSTARATDQPDKKAQPLKSVDFWAQYTDELWLIEVKDPEAASIVHQPGAVASVLKEILNDHLLKEHLLPKLYGAFAYLVEIGKEPRGRVRYGVVIGMSTLTAADRSMLTNKVQRIVDRIGPKIRYSRHWPLVEVHNVASWNHTHPHMSITRHP